MEIILDLVILIAMLLAYILPWVVALGRHHLNSLAIFWFVIFFGWTGIGWIIGFIWACTSNTKEAKKK